MKINKNQQQSYIRAKKNVKRIQIFYIHLVCYLIGAVLLLFNLYIIEDSMYRNNIFALNLSALFAWTVFIIIHGLSVFKGKTIFKKKWEDEKTEAYLKQKEDVNTTLWE